MTSILSRNTQNATGVNGEVSPRRVTDVIATIGKPDVICLQEVSRGLTLTDDAGAPDQIAKLSDLFRSYKIVFGAAVDAFCPNTTNTCSWVTPC